MLILRMGDPHAKVNNLEEMKSLIDFVNSIAENYQVDRIELLGDLFNNHAVLRLEVQEFWLWALPFLSKNRDVVALVGNHDQTGDYSSKFSSLSMFKSLKLERLFVVEEPLFTKNGIGYLPYMHKHEDFLKAANELAEKTATVLVCHQTIQGSKYENGFAALDGIPLGEWSKRFTHIISGHIHTEQEFDNVIYPGTARWDSIADANKRKGIWLFEHDDVTGKIVKKEFISTENVCTPILEIHYTEGENVPVIPNGKISLVLTGSSEWIRKEKEKFKGKVSIKSKITDSKVLEKRKPGKDFIDFLQNIFLTSFDKEKLLQIAKENGIVEL